MVNRLRRTHRFGFNLHPLPSAGFDLPRAVQDFSPHIEFGLALGECHTGLLLTHFEIPLFEKRFEDALHQDG